ncbi:MAG: hypothetical protein FWD05_02305 [Oscillospiraceae bacterium]|nr:hypothetical protein [Oscillospiraceae bacterium]
MNIAKRINDVQELQALIDRSEKVACIILGHESCPVFFEELPIDELIRCAQEANLEVQINIPVVFEEYLDSFKIEVTRLLKAYPGIKLILNDWGMVYFIRESFPDVKVTAGLGISFSYLECPWYHHIVEEEFEMYHDIIQTHNFDSTNMLDLLKEYNIDEIIMSDLRTLSASYERIAKSGISILINKNVSIVAISRACHILRILGKSEEKGQGCSKYCSNRTVLRTTHYYDMAMSVHDRVSEETKIMQPEMYYYANVLLAKNPVELSHGNHENFRLIIDDVRY